ncbi:hypothetical protein DFJ73DRAFT_858577, partial [Zopfochytrium polystomum]
MLASCAFKVVFILLFTHSNINNRNKKNIPGIGKVQACGLVRGLPERARSKSFAATTWASGTLPAAGCSVAPVHAEGAAAQRRMRRRVRLLARPQEELGQRPLAEPLEAVLPPAVSLPAQRVVAARARWVGLVVL